MQFLPRGFEGSPSRTLKWRLALRPTPRSATLTAALFLATAGCSGESAPPSTTPGPTPAPVTAVDTSAAAATVRLVTHDSFSISEATLGAFTTQTGARVEILTSGDAGTMLNAAILSADAPLGDVLYGVDNTLLGRALEAGVFEPYESAAAAAVDAAFRLDPAVTPVDFGDVCLNIDIGWFEAADLAPPAALEDLVAPEYAGLTVVEDPGTSSPGLAFLLTTVATLGDPGYLDWWAALAANDVAVSAGWEEAYYGDFSRYDGDRPIVVSYASSPPAEVVFADPPTDTPPTAAVTNDGTCFRQIEFAGVLAGAAAPDLGRALVDFMLGPEFQADLPLSMFVYPVVPDTPLPDVFVAHSTVPAVPATLDPATIAANRERWIEAWTDTVLG